MKFCQFFIIKDLELVTRLYCYCEIIIVQHGKKLHMVTII